MRDFQTPGRSLVHASNGMAATSHPLAALVAIDTLRAGGNAVDAAISGAVLLGICEPQMTGLGGDMFALVHRPGEPVIGLNGSGRAPAGLDATALRAAGHSSMPTHHGASVTVPGAVDAFCRLANDHGKLGLDRVLAPAIEYAENGVPVAPRVAHDWAAAQEYLSGHAREHYLHNGAPPVEGVLFRASVQAEVLRRIAHEGRKAFYTGEIAEDMIAALQDAGGTHTAADFEATACAYVQPITSSYRGHTITELPPNGHGATALLLAAMLEHFDIAVLDPAGADRAHIEAEAAKLAYDARNRFIGDAAPRLDHMLAPETASALAALIDPARALPNPRRTSGAVHKDTIYITVVDRDRMAVSLIYSIFHSFGSGIASEKFGILLHNRGAGFTLEPGHPNEAGPGKRPMHTIIPGLLNSPDGTTMPFGVMGGAYQPNGHARLISNLVDFGMDPQTAIDAPRSFSDDGVLRVERGYSDAVRADLASRGHKVEIPEVGIGGAQAIVIDGDRLTGASDPRKDGCALGY